MHQAFGQGTDFRRKSGGEQQVLPLFRQQSQNFFNVVNKAHVEHAVSFVQHQKFHRIKAHGILLIQVKQTTGASHQHIDATAQRDHLRVNADPTKHHGRTQLQIFAVFSDVFAHLSGQFAGWG